MGSCSLCQSGTRPQFNMVFVSFCLYFMADFIYGYLKKDLLVFLRQSTVLSLTITLMRKNTNLKFNNAKLAYFPRGAGSDL